MNWGDVLSDAVHLVDEVMEELLTLFTGGLKRLAGHWADN